MEKKHFLATATPTKEDFLQNMNEEEKAIMALHLSYVNQMAVEGEIFFSGACLDGAMGLIVYKADSYESALEMFNNDPLVRSSIMQTQLHPFKTGYFQSN